MSRYWLIVPLLLAAILIGNWVEEPATLVPESPMAIASSPADYLLEDFTTRHYAANGTLEYVLIGESLAHYPDDGRAEITRPSVTMQRDIAEWSVTAETGRLTREPDVVTLIGEVNIDRRVNGDTSNHPVSILARNVRIALDDDYLSTEDPVVIEAPGMVVEANGLQSSINEGKLELHSGVTARYEVAPSATDSGEPR